MIDVSALPSISLAELDAVGNLQNRFDEKYLVPTESLQEIIASNQMQLVALEHRGVRSTSYTSDYFDTADLRAYRDHVQGRRRRYKIRTRHYGNPSEGFLEVKLKLTREMTKKVRWATDTRRLGRDFSVEGERLVNGTLLEHYGTELGGHLHLTLRTSFMRTTLFHPTSGDRITIDSRVVVSNDYRETEFNSRFSIIEIKSKNTSSPMQRSLLTIGMRPTSMSKYCVGIAALCPGVPTNVWRPQLRKLAN